MKTFLSYPSERLDAAHRVFDFVRSLGIEIWFDKDTLVGGQDWDRERSKAQATTDLTLLICSPETISRTGVIQREIKDNLNGGAHVIEIAGEHAVDGRADGEATADEQPSGSDGEVELEKLAGSVEGELDRQGTDQSSRGKSENAAEQAFGQRDIETERHPEHRRGGGCQPEQRRENNHFHQVPPPGMGQRAPFLTFKPARVKVAREPFARYIEPRVESARARLHDDAPTA